MNVSLPPDLQAFVDDLVEREVVGAPQYAVEEGLRLLMAQEAFRKSERSRIKALVQEGIDDLDHGRSRDGEEVMREFAARYGVLAESEAA